jgi:hypothetical protein
MDRIPEYRISAIPSCNGATERDFQTIFKALEDRWNTKAEQISFEATARYFTRRTSDYALYLSLFWTQTYAIIQRTDP